MTDNLLTVFKLLRTTKQQYKAVCGSIYNNNNNYFGLFKQFNSYIR